jgi:hypothetical protein
VVSETYDELVFWEPTEVFYNRIKSVATNNKTDFRDLGGLPEYDEQAELNALLAARNRVADERASLLRASHEPM